MSEKLFVSNKDERARIFKNDLFEALSKTHWSVPILVYAPIIIYLLYLSSSTHLSTATIIGLFFLGIFVWSFMEYVMHRYIFHFEFKSKYGKKLYWYIHGVHHDYPQDSLRLVLPPGLSLPLALGFYLIFDLLLGSLINYPFFAGFLLGYVIYDVGHYAIHHFSIKNDLFKKIKRHHMQHHYINPEESFGVSSPFWDKIFNTTFSNKDNKINKQ